MKSLFVLFVLLLGLTANAAEYGELVISGEGKVTAKPDIGYISLAVVTEADTPTAASSQNSEAMTKLYKVLDDNQIPRTDVQTSNFSIQPKYLYEEKKEAKVVGYFVSNQVTVRVCVLEKMGVLLETLIKEGANRVGGISFGGQDEKTLLDQARVLATKDMLNKARLYSETAGFKVVKFKLFSESLGGRRPVQYKAAAADAAPGASGETPISGGELSFQVTVNATLEIK